MARPLRIEFPGALYHVTSRGNARQSIFPTDGDRQVFLSVLAAVVERFHWLCHGYCLMDNHYHLVIETPRSNLALGMRQLNGVYTQWFNKIHQSTGHLLQGRYKAIVIEKDAYLLEVSRYVVLNPVRAGAVERPEDWEWSNYRAMAGGVAAPRFLTVDWILSQFGDERDAAKRQYTRFIRTGIGDATVWDNLHGGVILGKERFLGTLRQFLKKRESAEEVPRKERFADRPTLETLFDGVSSRIERNKAIVSAHERYGYTLSEIGRFLTLHYSHVSRIYSSRGWERKKAKDKT